MADRGIPKVCHQLIPCAGDLRASERVWHLMLTQHGADALYALVSQLPPKSVFVEVGRRTGEETILLASAVREIRGGVFVSLGSEPSAGHFYDSMDTLDLMDFTDIFYEQEIGEESLSERYGDDSIAGVFIHSAPQSKIIKSIWTWSQKIKLNGLLCGDWTEDSRVAIMKETKGAFTRIGFDQSLWKIPLYSK